MKFYSYLQEKYVSLFKSWGYDVTIFCNPDHSEMSEMAADDYPDVRFIIDFKNKKLFTWLGTVHNEAYKYLVKHRDITIAGDYDSLTASNKYFFGLGQIKGRKIKYGYSHVLERKTKKEIKKFKWLGSDISWLSAYFTNTDFLTLDGLLAQSED